MAQSIYAPEKGYYWIQRKDSPEDWEIAYWDGSGTWYYFEASELSYGPMHDIYRLGRHVQHPSDNDGKVISEVEPDGRSD